ncbi:MAG: efflux RND transporter permease subunit [Verrucomicrobiota bacterium]
MNSSHSFKWFEGLIRYFAASKITPLLVVAAILLGTLSLVQLPREEEPQIVVPIFDIFVSYPGATSKETEKRIVELGERKFWEIPGVEYVYSTSHAHGAMFVVRFRVGEEMEKSLIQLYTKVYSNLDFLPSGAQQPVIKPRSIDDVPILALTFHSEKRSPVELRQIVARLRQQINSVPDVSETTLIGGRKRQFQVFFDEQKLNDFLLSPLELARIIQSANTRQSVGHLESSPRVVQIETDSFIQNKEDLARLVVGVTGGRIVYLSDVARIEDGPDEDERATQIYFHKGVMVSHSRFATSERESENLTPHAAFESITLAIAKRKGANATRISEDIHKKLKLWKGNLIPDDVQVTVTRDYGHTAAEKSNELLFHMALAIFGVSALIAWMLGKRAAVVVLIAIPTTLALTLATFHLFGFTINRITLFALIFTIGILVDDPIVGVENIVRHMHLAANRGKKMLEITVAAVQEIVSPLMLATLAVIAAILPMAFVGGLMGPYMRPIPIGATAAMIFSMIVSLVVTPWASVLFLKGDAHADHKEDFLTRLYRSYMKPLIYDAKTRKWFLIGMGGLLLLSLLLIPLRAVRVKMLPFDNKNEFQVMVNLPEGSSLDRTQTALAEMANEILKLTEVRDVQLHVGTSAPYNFNGLVRHYFLRSQPHQGDLQVNLVGKGQRKRQSHAIAESVRPELNRIAAKYGANMQVAEIPPGPPVLSTLVLEVYGPDEAARDALARKIELIMRETEGITDIASYVEYNQPLERFNIDIAKVALNGFSSDQIAQTLNIALQGQTVSLARIPDAEEPVEIFLRLPKEKRADDSALLNMRLLSRVGRPIPVADLIQKESRTQHHSIFHKNLMPASYVLGDVTDQLGSPVYAILKLQKELKKLKTPDGKPIPILFTHQPTDQNAWHIKWDGEWQITYEVFRDLGAAFAIVLILIFILVVGWFQSFKTPWIVMLPIPLSLVGIIPAHWLTGIFFTATSMIGLIAGAGIVVRNAIILVDFIELKLSEGESLEEAVIDAGAVRFRPMLLTAAAVVVGAAVILFDPIFQGLALSLIAGEVASTILSRTAVPVLYYVMTTRK